MKKTSSWVLILLVALSVHAIIVELEVHDLRADAVRLHNENATHSTLLQTLANNDIATVKILEEFLGKIVELQGR